MCELSNCISGLKNWISRIIRNHENKNYVKTWLNFTDDKEKTLQIPNYLLTWIKEFQLADAKKYGWNENYNISGITNDRSHERETKFQTHNIFTHKLKLLNIQASNSQKIPGNILTTFQKTNSHNYIVSHTHTSSVFRRLTLQTRKHFQGFIPRNKFL